MNEPVADPGAPRHVLLATDLSARGDRALERAAMLARRHDARLTLVHVIEEFDEATLRYDKQAAPSWRRPPDAVSMLKRRIMQGLHEDLGEAVNNATVLIEQGDPSEVIEQVAAAERADLVVTGIAREGLFASRPVVLGKTVEQLLRRLPLPILIVRNRARDDYRNVVVTTDFSPPSGYALQVALRFFPQQTLHLLHAFEAPYSTMVSDPVKHADGYREHHAAALGEFLAAVYLPDDGRRRLVPVIEPGAAPQIVREFVRVRGADLVVLGTHGRGAVLEALVGSTAKSILATLECDALVVRGPRR